MWRAQVFEEGTKMAVRDRNSLARSAADGGADDGDSLAGCAASGAVRRRMVRRPHMRWPPRVASGRRRRPRGGRGGPR